MLNIFLRDDNIKFEKEVVRDVEREFARLRVKGTDLDKLLIEKIEKGKYNDVNSYIDRFGYKLHYEDMSTSCKAALCVVNLPDKIIDLIECGYNGRDTIIKFCSNGNIIMDDNSLTISTQYGNDIDVKLDSYRFTPSSNISC